MTSRTSNAVASPELEMTITRTLNVPRDLAFTVWNEHRLGKGEIESLTRLQEEMEEIQAEENEE